MLQKQKGTLSQCTARPGQCIKTFLAQFRSLAQLHHLWQRSIPLGVLTLQIDHDSVEARCIQTRGHMQRNIRFEDPVGDGTAEEGHQHIGGVWDWVGSRLFVVPGPLGVWGVMVCRQGRRQQVQQPAAVDGGG